MSEPFKVPEPSEEAVRGAHGVWFGERAIYAATEANLGYWREAAQKLYAVDIPRIVRAEVERALASFSEPGVQSVVTDLAAKYVRERFGGAAPEGTHTCPNCGKHFLSKPGPRPGCLVLHPSGVCCHYGEVEATPPERREPTGFLAEAHIGHTEHGDRVYAMSGAPDRLAKLERFCSALARIYEVANPGDSRVTNVRAAAREYLRP